MPEGNGTPVWVGGELKEYLSVSRRIIGCLNGSTRRELKFFILFFCFASLCELVCSGSIMPFFALVSDIKAYRNRPGIAAVSEQLHITNDHDFILAAGGATACVVAVGSFVSAVSLWWTVRLSSRLNSQTSARAYQNILDHDYDWHCKQNSNHLVGAVVSEAPAVVQGYLVAGVRCLGRLCVIVTIVLSIIFINPWAALISLFFLSVAYGAIYLRIRDRLISIGAKKAALDRQRVKCVVEPLQSLKSTILLRKAEFFSSRYERLTEKSSEMLVRQSMFSEAPRFMLELTAYLGIIFCILAMFSRGQDFQSATISLAVYAFAALRLMPAIQQLFSFITSIKAHGYIAGTLADSLERPTRVIHRSESRPSAHFEHELTFHNVSVQFEGREQPALDRVSFRIKKNSCVAFVGATGAGKSTIVDILLGLRTPDEGQVRVDGRDLSGLDMNSWMAQIGLVPQEIYLADDTIDANIGFGLSEDELRREFVESAARDASIHDFVMALPERYRTIIGDRGMRLSGGQRQRLAIARALYSNPSVLVFDEATSALDGATEREIMDSVGLLSGRKTIVFIAHRMSTIQTCDEIFYLRGGRLVDQGSYADLLERNSEFRKMATGNEAIPVIT